MKDTPSLEWDYGILLLDLLARDSEANPGPASTQMPVRCACKGGKMDRQGEHCVRDAMCGFTQGVLTFAMRHTSFPFTQHLTDLLLLWLAPVLKWTVCNHLAGVHSPSIEEHVKGFFAASVLNLLCRTPRPPA